MSQQTTPPTRRRNGLQLGVLLLALLSFFLFSPASASQIGISGPRRAYAASLSPCSRDAISVTNTTTGTTATQVDLSGLNASNCSGKTIQLWLRDGTVATLNATNATVSTSTATMTLSSYTPADVAGAIVYVGGWPMPTTWTYTPVILPVVSCAPISGSETCSVEEIFSFSWGTGNDIIWQKTFRVSTTSTTEVPWQVTINMSNPTLPAFSSDLQDNSSGAVVPISNSGCSATPRTVTVKGTTNWGNFNTVVSGRVSEFQVQGQNSGEGNLINC